MVNDLKAGHVINDDDEDDLLLLIAVHTREAGNRHR